MEWFKLFSGPNLDFQCLALLCALISELAPLGNGPSDGFLIYPRKVRRVQVFVLPGQVDRVSSTLLHPGTCQASNCDLEVPVTGKSFTFCPRHARRSSNRPSPFTYSAARWDLNGSQRLCYAGRGVGSIPRGYLLDSLLLRGQDVAWNSRSSSLGGGDR